MLLKSVWPLKSIEEKKSKYIIRDLCALSVTEGGVSRWFKGTPFELTPLSHDVRPLTSPCASALGCDVSAGSIAMECSEGLTSPKAW